MTLTYGEMFAGIGGMSLGLERAGWTPQWFAEREPFPSRVLAKHWPDVPNLGDVTTIEWRDVERVHLVCAGFPCQPFSTAGKQRGADDERYLWPEVVRCLGVLRPRFVLLENVAGLLAAPEFGYVLGDLADLGYDAEWSVVSACSVGAPHRRRRLFIVAHADGLGLQRWQRDGVRDTSGEVQIQVPRRSAYWTAVPEPESCGMAHGVPGRVDRLRGVGNAVVPQVAELIGRRLAEQAVLA